MTVEITVYEMYNYIKQTFISLKHRNNLTVTVTLKSDKVSVHTFKNNNQKSQRAITIAMTNNKKQQETTNLPFVKTRQARLHKIHTANVPIVYFHLQKITK